MSKRNVALLALVVLFAFSVVAFAAMPAAPSVAVSSGVTVASFHVVWTHALFDPTCPGASSTGCGG